MRASELRKGNWVNEYGVPIQITPQHILGLHQIEVAGKICIDLEPIPLTEEWLIRLGAKKYRNVIYIPVTNLKAEMHFEIYGEEIVTTIKSQFSDLILDRIKHVHQLMNLFYALTGEELTLTDKL